MDKINRQKVARVLAHLIANGVDPAAIENAVTSAQNMKMGEQSTMDDGNTMRRVFVYAQTERLK